MLLFNGKTKDKLLQTKLHTEVNLRSSLFTRVWSFVFKSKSNNHMNKKLLHFAILAILLVPSLSFASFDQSLKYGSRGDAVSELQDFLQDQGFLTGKIDGKFGLGTVKAVKAWQSANELKADGYFGLGSRAKANEALNAILKDSDATEQAETGTVAPLSTISGCTSTSGFSPLTGAKCDGSVTEPVIPTISKSSQIDALTKDYNSKIADLNQQILDIKTQYEKDIVANEGRPVPMNDMQGMAQKILQDANRKIDQINLQIQQLTLDYQKQVSTLANASTVMYNAFMPEDCKSTIEATIDNPIVDLQFSNLLPDGRPTSNILIYRVEPKLHITSNCDLKDKKLDIEVFFKDGKQYNRVPLVVPLKNGLYKIAGGWSTNISLTTIDSGWTADIDGIFEFERTEKSDYIFQFTFDGVTSSLPVSLSDKTPY